MKEPLRKVLGKAWLSYAELTTVLTRIEAVINTTPLTAVSDDFRDPTPITPAHLTLGRSLFDLPDFEEVPVNEDTTRQRYLYHRGWLITSGSNGEESIYTSYLFDQNRKKSNQPLALEM